MSQISEGFGTTTTVAARGYREGLHSCREAIAVAAYSSNGGSSRLGEDVMLRLKPYPLAYGHHKPGASRDSRVGKATAGDMSPMIARRLRGHQGSVLPLLVVAVVAIVAASPPAPAAASVGPPDAAPAAAVPAGLEWRRRRGDELYLIGVGCQKCGTTSLNMELNFLEWAKPAVRKVSKGCSHNIEVSERGNMQKLRSDYPLTD